MLALVCGLISSSAVSAQVKFDLYTITEVDTPRSGWSVSMMSNATGVSSIRSGVSHGAFLPRDPDADNSSTYSGRGGPAPRVPAARRR